MHVWLIIDDFALPVIGFKNNVYPITTVFQTMRGQDVRQVFLLDNNADFFETFTYSTLFEALVSLYFAGRQAEITITPAGISTQQKSVFAVFFEH